MISFTELNEQNHKITELSNVLSHLIEDRGLCDTTITRALFFDYIRQVNEHLTIEEKELYQELLIHSNQRVKNTANMFLSGSGEIKRIFKQYLRRWCTGTKVRGNQALRIRSHDKFLQATNDMFEIVLKRIEDETEHFYPIVREIYGSRMPN